MKLSELKTGEQAYIVKVSGHGGFRKRIIEMGFIKGQPVEALLNAPLQDPVNPDIELWTGALLRINSAGIKRIGAIHRGFSSVDSKLYRNPPMWHLPIELKRRFPTLPIICDPSHMGGRRDLIAPLSQQAMDLGFEGLMVESHCNPDCAWSDAKQQVLPEVLDFILDRLSRVQETPQHDRRADHPLQRDPRQARCPGCPLRHEPRLHP